MTCNIRLIDPMTSTSTHHSAPALDDALVLVAQIHDKHIIITDADTGEELANILPLDLVPSSDLHRAIAGMVGE